MVSPGLEGLDELMPAESGSSRGHQKSLESDASTVYEVLPGGTLAAKSGTLD